MTEAQQTSLTDRGACPWCGRPAIGDTRACPDCGRPQHYTGTEHGWAHDALIDTWHCNDPAARDGRA